MTSPDTLVLDRCTPPAWELVSDWFVDPLERVMLVALVLVSAVLLVVLASQREAEAGPGLDACVMTVVDDARAFAAVLGDDRPVPYAFAERTCARQAG